MSAAEPASEAPPAGALRLGPVHLTVADLDRAIEAAGAPVDEVAGGFRAYDPWRVATDFVASA